MYHLCALTSGDTGVAVVQFTDHHRARDVSRLFAINGIGKQAWRGRRLLLDTAEECKIYGWLAEQEDMLQLPNYKKKWRMMLLEDVQDDSLETLKKNAIIRRG